MENETKIAPVSPEGSPDVDQELLQKIAEINEELERHGISLDIGYRLAPALGGIVIRESRHPSTSAHNPPFRPVMPSAR